MRVNNGDGNEYILKQAIEKLPVDFSAIIIDCPPGLGFFDYKCFNSIK